ncbi:hypothetical protein V6N12_076241 [Hibiscus sabdariffa]
MDRCMSFRVLIWGESLMGYKLLGQNGVRLSCWEMNGGCRRNENGGFGQWQCCGVFDDEGGVKVGGSLMKGIMETR